LPRLSFDESRESLRVTVTPSLGARVFAVLLILANLGFAAAITLETARLVRKYGGIPSPSGFLLLLVLLMILWLAVGLAIAQLGESYRLELGPDTLSIQRHVFGRALRRKVHPLGDAASFVEPKRPRFLSAQVSSPNVLVLDSAPDVGISRGIFGSACTAELKSRLNAFLSARSGDLSAG